MANYMVEVAKLLGVEFGEEFRTDVCIGPFYISHEALYGVNDGIKQDGVLRALLSGKQRIIKYCDTPCYGDTFYYVAKNKKVYCELWEDTTFNLILNKIGNCYKSKQEAEVNRDKWISFYASDEVLEV